MVLGNHPFKSKCDLTLSSIFSPGRFFATNEVKAMLAYVLLNYDIKMAKRPSELWFGFSSIPDPTAEVMFRKRMT